jgi:hypothetical protein
MTKDQLPGTMQWVPTSALIDFSTWSLAAWLPDGRRKIVEQFTEVVREEFEKNPPYLDFPILWESCDAGDGRHGPSPSDPVTLYLDLPLGQFDGNNVCYSCSLEDVVDDLIDSLVVASGRVEDAKSRAICAKVAARLRELADKLDTVCRESQP